MDFRHEWKHEISYSDVLVLRQRLRAVAVPDEHGRLGKYRIRSLYFDSPSDKALREKQDGVNRREKFRIRCYNGDLGLIRLEKKYKENGLCAKSSAALTAEETAKLLRGELDWMVQQERPLLTELHAKMTLQGLRPRTLVDYTREAYTYAPGNVRITLDYDIRSGLLCTDFLRSECLTVPICSAPVILEVKWDAFLPDVIRDLIQLPGRHTSPYSKYAACRIYG